MRQSQKYDHYLQRRIRELANDQPDTVAGVRLQITARYTGDLEALRERGMHVLGSAGGIAIGDIAVGDLEKLEQLDQVTFISTEPPVRAHLNTSVPEIHADVVRNGSPPFTGSGVIIGIVDSGIDIFHHNMRKADGTSRVLSIWDQTINATGSQKPPAGYTSGVLFAAADIANALAHPDQAFAHQDVIGHGTHVAGIAAGNGSQGGNCHGSGRYWGVAPEADLIIVKALTDKTSTNQATSLTQATQYIFQQAAAQAPAKSCVINMSLQWGLGPRDGTTNEEIFLDGLLSGTHGMAVVVSAGNDGDIGTADDVAQGLYNAGFHTAKHIVANGNATLTLMVPPDDKKADHLDLWYSAGAGRLQVQVKGPTGVVAGPVAAGAGTVHLNVGPATVDITSTVNNANNNKGAIFISIDPPANGSIPSGTWTFTLTETAGTAVDLDLWIFNSHGDPNAVLAFADRVRATTVTSPGTAKNVITVGAYGSEDGKLADFSSRGPTRAADNRQKPEICAPGLESSPSEGITAPRAKAEGGCCCDCCYDFYVDEQGTSMAAPHVAGVVALMLQKNANLTFDQLRTTIQTFCRPPSGVAPLPNNDWGYGKVDAQLAIANIPPGSAFTGDPAPSGAPAGSPGSGGPTGVLSTASSERVSPADGATKPLPLLRQAFSPASLRIARRLQQLAARGRDNPAAQMAMWLISTHFDEVIGLINSNRRIAAKWHRMFGPEMLRRTLWNQNRLAPVLPDTIQNHRVASGMWELFAVLRRYGSEALRRDLTDYGSLLLALPGADFSTLDSQRQ